MILKRLSNGDLLTITNNVVWVDEFDHAPITQELSYTIGGSFIIDDAPPSQALKGGRKITLITGDGVGVTRVTMVKLYALAILSGEFFELTLPNGTTKGVIFDKMNKPVSGTPLTRINVIPDDQPYTNCTFKFLEATAI